jgi:hypothetical protein
VDNFKAVGSAFCYQQVKGIGAKIHHGDAFGGRVILLRHGQKLKIPAKVCLSQGIFEFMMWFG